MSWTRSGWPRSAPDLIVTQAVCDVCAFSYEDVLEVAARLPERAPRPPAGPEHPRRGAGRRDPPRRGNRDAAGGARAARRARGQAGDGPAAVAGASAPRVIALEWLDPPFVGGHWVPEMISIAGGEDVAGPPGPKSPEVGWGALAGLEPDVVIAMPCGWGSRGGPRPGARALGADRRARRPLGLRRRRRRQLLPPGPAPGRRGRAARPHAPPRTSSTRPAASGSPRCGRRSRLAPASGVSYPRIWRNSHRKT